jgi:hypothetical protein
MELEANGHRAPLLLFLSRTLKIVVFYCREWQCFRQELDARQELLVIDPRCHEFTRMNLSASFLTVSPLSMSRRQIFGVGSEGVQVDEIKLR